MAIRDFKIYRIAGEDHFFDDEEGNFVPTKHFSPRRPSTGAAAVPESPVPSEKELELDLVLEERLV